MEIYEFLIGMEKIKSPGNNGLTKYCTSWI